MARIDALPSIEIIRGFKGILDFYLWRGLPCARAWPRYRPARQTDPSKAAALLFGAIVKAYSLLGDAPLEAYRADAADQPRTARDIMVSGVYGNLHEASMSDFLDLLTQCRDFLSNLQALLTALDSIDTDELVVNVDQSVLPPLAATTTNQATMITALQKLDDLQDALQSNALDRLLVRGMDQLFSIKSTLADHHVDFISGADGFVRSPAVPAGQYWIITTISVRDITSPVTKIHMSNRHDNVNVPIHEEIRAFAAGDRCSWAGTTILDPDDQLHVNYIGGLAGDTCTLDYTGYIITLET